MTFGDRYDSLSAKDKSEWAERFVGFFHALGVLFFVVPIFLFDEHLAANPVLGHSDWPIRVYAASTGYFLWDIVVSVISWRRGGDFGFVVHGVCCFCVYIFCFRPYLQFYASVFLIFELSTPFLHLVWFCERIGLKDHPIRAVFAVLLALCFFCSRIVFGLYQSYKFFKDTFALADEIPPFLIWFYSIINIILCTLNIYWFSLIVKKAVRQITRSSSTELQKPSSVPDKAKD